MLGWLRGTVPAMVGTGAGVLADKVAGAVALVPVVPKVPELRGEVSGAAVGPGALMRPAAVGAGAAPAAALVGAEVAVGKI